jgi:hypothetical protein
MVQHPVESEKSIDAESERISNRECFDPLQHTAFCKEQLKNVTLSRVYPTERFIRSGKLEKLESRLAAGGHKRYRIGYEDISSPFVFMISTLVAEEGKSVDTPDITGAYLNADMSDDHEVLLRLDKAIASRVVRIRPDELTTGTFLSTRINAPIEQDWTKLNRLLKYINSTKDSGIELDSDRDVCVLVYVDISYGVHADGKILSGKQKTKSCTETERVGLSDLAGQTIWTRNFLGTEGQGYKMGPSTVYEDNMSIIKLERKRRSTRHIRMRYFFIVDRISGGEIQLEHLSTKCEIADMLTNISRAMKRQLLNKPSMENLSCHDKEAIELGIGPH